MKRLLIVSLALIATSASWAQNTTIQREGIIDKNGTIEVLTPTTTLAIDLTVQCEKVVSGPYARYAQRFLGARAQLTDRTTYSLVSAEIALANCDAYAINATPNTTTTEVISHINADDKFLGVLPDKDQLEMLPLEQAAQLAAETIYTIRRNRQQLVNPNYQDAMGGGLEAALAELTRLEQAYLELFLGKNTITTHTQRYILKPNAESRQYIFARFSTSSGLVADNDLSGEVLLLQITPSEPSQKPATAGPKQEWVAFRVAAPSMCEISFAGTSLSRRELPIFQFGPLVQVAVPTK